MFKLNDFMASISTKGVLKSTRYLVSFTPPASLRGKNDLPGSDLITIRCDSVQFPGMSFASIDGPPRHGYGPNEATPYSTVFDDITLSFIVDAGSEIHKFFYTWMNTVVNFHGAGGYRLKEARGPVAGMTSYEVGYKDNFCVDMSIAVYDAADDKVMEAKVYRAFPKLLPSLDFSWGAQDEIIKLTIPFSYVDFDVNYFPLK